MKPKKINIEFRHRFFEEQKRLVHERILILKEILNQVTDPTLKHFQYLFEIWKYNNSQNDKETLMNILKRKIELIESGPDKNEYLREIFFCKKSIEQETVTPVIDYYSHEYLNILQGEIDYLTEKEKSTSNLLEKNSLNITLFYKTDELNTLQMGDPTFISKQKSDVLIEAKIKHKYIEIIGLLQERIKILQEFLKDKSKSKLEKNSAALEIHRIKAEIESKKEFIGHYRARKEIYG